MNKKMIIWIFVVLIITVFVFLLADKNNKKSTDNSIIDKTEDIINTEKDNGVVKEFSMTSFVDMTGGSPKPQYSLKEISVNKGDKVRIKVTVTSGMHNFNIDEYNIHVDTELNKEVVVEFVADKTGEFTYYCSRPGHRANGHFGTLKVI